MSPLDLSLRYIWIKLSTPECIFVVINTANLLEPSGKALHIIHQYSPEQILSLLREKGNGRRFLQLYTLKGKGVWTGCSEPADSPGMFNLLL